MPFLSPMRTEIEHLDLSVWPIFSQMSARGLLLDQTRVHDLSTDIDRQLVETQERLESLVGRHLNPASGDDVAAWMKSVGLAGKKTKSKERLSTDSRALWLHASIPAIAEISKSRELSKLKTAFVAVLLEACKRTPPTIHPRWKLTRVKSGRVACEDPNLMAFPSRTELGRKVRGCFVARPGYKMVSVDYAQIEPRMVASLSQDEKLLAIFRESRDLYTETARGLFRLSDTDKVDLFLHRRPSKVVTLGVLYGIGDRRLYEELVRSGSNFFDVEGCAALIADWFALYPEVQRLVDVTCYEARKNDGWVYTEGGRGRSLPALFLDGNRWPAAKLREEAERQAFNHLIQGTSQEKMKEGMLRVQANEPKFLPLLQMHDELVGEAKESIAEEVARSVATLMASDGNGVQFTTSHAIAGDWGALK